MTIHIPEDQFPLSRVRAELYVLRLSASPDDETGIDTSAEEPLFSMSGSLSVKINILLNENDLLERL